MTDPENRPETPEETEELKRRWAKALEEMPTGATGDGGSPSFGGRAFAVVLLLFVAPLLLFLGSCGVMASTTIIGPIMLGIFAATAFVSYKGVQTLWRGDWSGGGWVLALILLALISAAIYIGASQPLGWHN